jgi:hypothetical protein
MVVFLLVFAHDGTRQDMCSGSGSAAATGGFLAKRFNPPFFAAVLFVTLKYCRT